MGILLGLQGAPLAADTVVLLKNGGLLEGQVSYADGRYLVVGNGSEIRLPAESVERLAKSRAELYEWRRAKLTPGVAEQRLELALWCTRSQMWREASRELMETRAMEPNHPMLKTVELRLAEAWKQASLAPTEREKPEDTTDDAVEARDNPWDVLEDQLPEGALEHFTRRVQPILVNNCTTSGCHRPDGEQTFQLNRDCIHGMGDRRSTFANLESVLATINADSAADSLLLAAARQPHGGMATGPLTGRQQPLLEVVENWVRHVSTPTQQVAPQPMARAPQRPAFSGLIGGGFQAVPAVVQENATAAAPAGPPRQDGQVQQAEYVESYSPIETGRVIRGGSLQQVAPRDEFDPEIFNQHYLAPDEQGDESAAPE